MTISDRIMKAAEEALDNLLCNCAESCGGYEGARAASVLEIARAIAAESDTCLPQALLIKHLAEYTTDRNWADKRLYIMQAADRLIAEITQFEELK